MFDITAKLNGLEQQACIADAIEKIAGDLPAARWAELMRRNWTEDQRAVAQAAATALLGPRSPSIKD